MPSEIKKIISPDNYVLASAAVPEGYITGGALQQQRQHERALYHVGACAEYREADFPVCTLR